MGRVEGEEQGRAEATQEHSELAAAVTRTHGPPAEKECGMATRSLGGIRGEGRAGRWTAARCRRPAPPVRWPKSERGPQAGRSPAG